MVPQERVVIIVQCVMHTHTQKLPLHMQIPEGRELQAPPVAFRVPVKNKQRQQQQTQQQTVNIVKLYMQLFMTLLQHPTGGHSCYCTLETPESQIICDLFPR